MIDFVETVGLKKYFESEKIDYYGKNFEVLYDELSQSDKYALFLSGFNTQTLASFSFFSSDLKIPCSLLRSERSERWVIHFD